MSPAAKRGWALATGLLLAALAWDLSRPPLEQWTARGLLVGIDFYQDRVSEPLGRHGVRCRFQPTCSHYAEGVIRQHGALAGGGRAVWRILRCGPWTAAGTEDPP
jgi:putative membrane protein insertion efficiency factor